MATTTSGTSAQNTYRYKPYGEQLAKTGGAADPQFMWVGAWGYLHQAGAVYVRSRHVDMGIGEWTSRDILWPFLHPYAYANNSPVTWVDSSGFAPINYKVKAFIHKRHSDPRYSPPNTH